ncbi:hypothetical protein QUB70_16160 [Microcoleus sp. A003_D6]
MPTPQEIDMLWNRYLACFFGRARCPPHKKLICCGTGILPVSLGGQDAQPTRI